MKVQEIANTYGIDRDHFLFWLESSGYQFKRKMLDTDVDDSQNIAEIVEKFKQSVAKQQESLQQKSKELATVLVTSGFNFDGYTITKYSGYISGDDITEIHRGSVANQVLPSMVQIRRNALIELKQAALDLGCNAVIGVDFDYIWIDPVTVGNNGGMVYYPYISGVTANGNAVIIEPNTRTSS